HCCRYFFFHAEDGIRDRNVTGVQTCALPIYSARRNFSTTQNPGFQRPTGTTLLTAVSDRLLAHHRRRRSDGCTPSRRPERSTATSSGRSTAYLRGTRSRPHPTATWHQPARGRSGCCKRRPIMVLPQPQLSIQ